MPTGSKAKRVPRRLERVAYHEAGHAVVAIRQGRKFGHVGATPGDVAGGPSRIHAAGGRATTDPDDPAEPAGGLSADGEVFYLLAGFAAESLRFGERDFLGGASDLERVRKFAEGLYGPAGGAAGGISTFRSRWPSSGSASPRPGSRSSTWRGC